MSHRLQVETLGTTFQNPVLLAAGTCGFGREIGDVVDLEALGGLVTKSVTPEPREGNPAPRVTEFGAGMLNSIGLANPGLQRVLREELPWLRDSLRRARVVVSVAAHTPEGYERVVDGLAGEEGFVAFELNLSCPNDTRLGGRPFALDPEAVHDVVSRCRRATGRALAVKLAPNDPDLASTVVAAEDAGADAFTLVNTLPGLVLDRRTGEPALGAGQGGVSGPALRAVGVRAVAAAREATALPILGVGGIVRVDDAIQYLRAGATLVQVGTASFADPRAAERIVRRLPRELDRLGVASLGELAAIGTAAHPPERVPLPAGRTA
ncbi:MAG: dihydroorotate dehydrogenase [Gemmatimonadota bacterium]|jgi:dihydroorotate dehydrogenase (NAD+) catalytic subunit